MHPLAHVVEAASREFRHSFRTVRDERQRLKSERKAVVVTEEAQQILQTVAAAVQAKAHKQIAKVVTRCLRAVFKEPYEFLIVFERKRGKTDARLCFKRGGIEIDPQTGDSGGVLNVAAFALRVACLLLASPKRRRVLFLDEPFPGVSRDNGRRVADLLMTLSRELKIQIIMTTHSPELVTGKVVRIGV